MDQADGRTSVSLAQGRGVQLSAKSKRQRRRMLSNLETLKEMFPEKSENALRRALNTQVCLCAASDEQIDLDVTFSADHPFSIVSVCSPITAWPRCRH